MPGTVTPSSAASTSDSRHECQYPDIALDPTTNEYPFQRKMVFCELLTSQFTPAQLVQNRPELQLNPHLGLSVVLGQIGPGIDQFAQPVTDDMDPGQKRTPQRAELLAALMGLRRAMDGDLHDYEGYDAAAVKERIIATDSEYVVKGMTEWMGQWRRNGWKTSFGMKPANLDLFQLLERTIEEMEVEHNAVFGFWQVPKIVNRDAEKMARAAAKGALTGKKVEPGSGEKGASDEKGGAEASAEGSRKRLVKVGAVEGGEKS
ncbi:ribonuclease H-like protein [Schizophyllum commune Tattone D]|nr:ribonuclease H-like protein [Schizophyllum commune Tattone D]